VENDPQIKPEAIFLQSYFIVFLRYLQERVFTLIFIKVAKKSGSRTFIVDAPKEFTSLPVLKVSIIESMLMDSISNTFGTDKDMDSLRALDVDVLKPVFGHIDKD
jgi:hypothetical protein